MLLKQHQVGDSVLGLLESLPKGLHTLLPSRRLTFSSGSGLFSFLFCSAEEAQWEGKQRGGRYLHHHHPHTTTHPTPQSRACTPPPSPTQALPAPGLCMQGRKPSLSLQPARSPNSAHAGPQPDLWQLTQPTHGCALWRGQQRHCTTACAPWSLFLESCRQDSLVLGVGEPLAPGVCI